MRILPKIKFQLKLFLSNIFLTALACFALGFTVSKISSEIYLQMFLDDYNAHIHPTGVGPSGPPMPPTPTTVGKLSSTHIKYQQKGK